LEWSWPGWPATSAAMSEVEMRREKCIVKLPVSSHFLELHSCTVAEFLELQNFLNPQKKLGA
jgi:hypothetical protein